MGRNSLQQRLTEAAKKEINEELPGNLTSIPRLLRVQKESLPKGRSTTALAATVDVIPAGALRPGMQIMCHGKPGTLKHVCMSKTGKHGHSKVFVTVACDDGVTRQDIVQASHDVQLLR